MFPVTGFAGSIELKALRALMHITEAQDTVIMGSTSIRAIDFSIL
jgi:hypothetical protein